MFEARGWKNGTNRSSLTLGLAISPQDRDRNFRRAWKTVAVRLPGRCGTTIVPLTPSFWTTCPELRSRHITACLRASGAFPWPLGHPPRFTIHATGLARFIEWLREFYRVRGDFSHGRLTTRQPMVWNATEHLTLAAIAFPLVVRCLLQRAGTYTLTHDDIAAIEAFEPFADQAGFLQPPPDSGGSMDAWWARMLTRAKSRA